MQNTVNELAALLASTIPSQFYPVRWELDDKLISAYLQHIATWRDDFKNNATSFHAVATTVLEQTCAAYRLQAVVPYPSKLLDPIQAYQALLGISEDLRNLFHVNNLDDIYSDTLYSAILVAYYHDKALNPTKPFHALIEAVSEQYLATGYPHDLMDDYFRANKRVYINTMYAATYEYPSDFAIELDYNDINSINNAIGVINHDHD